MRIVRSIVLCIILPSIVVLIFTITSAGSPGTDEVYFGPPDQETEIILVGSSSVSLRVRFGQECSNYTLEVESGLFLFPSTMHNRDGYVEANSTHGHMVLVDASAPPGDYEVSIRLAYDTLDGQRWVSKFDKTISYLRALEIKRIRLPSYSRKEFVITVETFLVFDDFDVLFDSDGDIGVNPENLTFANLSIGTHTFITEIYRSDSGGGNQEVGYYISASIHNKTLVITEKNIIVEIDWEADEEESNDYFQVSNNKWSITIAISVLILILFLFNYIYYFKRPTSMTDREE